MTNLALLVLRLVTGGLMAGHGTQKLFGWWSGPGLKGTQGFMEKLGMRPGHVWGTMAAVGETSGGVLTALGALHPLGPLNIMSAMIVAARRAHWGKPIWVTSGGAELPLTNLAIAASLAMTGPGKISVDRMLGFRMPRQLAVLAWISTAAITIAAIRKPEVAQTVVEKAATVMPEALRGTVAPDLEMETRPTPSMEEASQEAGVGL